MKALKIVSNAYSEESAIKTNSGPHSTSRTRCRETFKQMEIITLICLQAWMLILSETVKLCKIISLSASSSSVDIPLQSSETLYNNTGARHLLQQQLLSCAYCPSNYEMLLPSDEYQEEYIYLI